MSNPQIPKEADRLVGMRTYRKMLLAYRVFSTIELQAVRRYLVAIHGADEIIQAENEVERRIEHDNS